MATDKKPMPFGAAKGKKNAAAGQLKKGLKGKGGKKK